jgi:hypothetical protein
MAAVEGENILYCLMRINMMFNLLPRKRERSTAATVAQKATDGTDESTGRNESIVNPNGTKSTIIVMEGNGSECIGMTTGPVDVVDHVQLQAQQDLHHDQYHVRGGQYRSLKIVLINVEKIRSTNGIGGVDLAMIMMMMVVVVRIQTKEGRYWRAFLAAMTGVNVDLGDAGEMSLSI